MTITSYPPEPAPGEIRFIRDADGDLLFVQRCDQHPTAAGDDRWIDVTCPPEERAACSWASLDVAEVHTLSDALDLATTDEPHDGSRVAVRLHNATTGEDQWYTFRRDDDDLPEEDEDDEPGQPEPWRIEQCYAGDISWDPGYYGRCTWENIAASKDTSTLITVHLILY